jgi:hypothetical protein
MTRLSYQAEPFKKNFLCLRTAAFVVILISSARAGTEEESKVVAQTQASSEAVPLDLFKLEAGYVFESDLNHGGSFGKQDEIQLELEYGRRVQLTGNYYLHLGVAYERYDFGSTDAPVPNHLQSIEGVVGVDYMHGDDVGAFLQVRPGFYFQNEIGISSFDVPISVGRIFVVQQDKFYILAGAYASFLRGNFPVLPLAGVIWIPSRQLRLMAVLPEPKLIYSPTSKLDLWVGGEFVGGSYRTDRNDDIQPRKLNGTQVDFTDYRAGVGFTYAVSKCLSVDVGAGCSIQRQFDFARAGEVFRTDPSPYVRLQLKASF